MRASAPGMVTRRLRRDAVSDERLVARVRAGDTGAFEAIYDRYAGLIHSSCRHTLGQPDDADDAVQHTFLAAYRAIRQSAQPIDLKPWLFTIARNRCVSVLRAWRRDPSVADGEAPEPITEGLVAAVERRESLRALLRDIGALPEDQRSALILTQLGTLKHEEVARVLGVPTEKVKALVFQARNSLVSTRLARETACHDFRQQLATLTGPALRRGNLRRHLVSCSGCRDYQLALKRQRAAIVVLLPVAAHPALRSKVLGEIVGGAGGGSSTGAGAGGALSGLAAKGAALKVGLAMGVAATGGGVATLTGGVKRAFGEGKATPATVVADSALPAPTMKPASAAPQQTTWPGRHVLRVTSPRHSGSIRQPSRRVGQSPAHDPGTAAPEADAQQSSPVNPTSASTTQTQTETSSPPGQSKKGSSPPGQSKKRGSPPGLAKKNAGSVRPGQAKKNGTGSVPPGQA